MQIIFYKARVDETRFTAQPPNKPNRRFTLAYRSHEESVVPYGVKTLIDSMWSEVIENWNKFCVSVLFYSM